MTANFPFSADPEIQWSLTVSTVHLSDKTRRLLEDARLDVLTIPFGYGWILWVDEDHLLADPPTLEPDALAVMRLARDQGCQWVKFDCDGPQIEGLAEYEWEPNAPDETPSGSELLKLVKDLVAWSDRLGGWDAPVWRRARLAAGLLDGEED